jgi:hypothetical protein
MLSAGDFTFTAFSHTIIFSSLLAKEHDRAREELALLGRSVNLRRGSRRERTRTTVFLFGRRKIAGRLFGFPLGSLLVICRKLQIGRVGDRSAGA